MTRSRVPSALWTFPAFRAASSRAKLAYLNLVAGPTRPVVPGLYVASALTIAVALRCRMSTARRALSELETAGLVEVDWPHALVWVRGEEVPRPNPNMRVGWAKGLARLAAPLAGRVRAWLERQTASPLPALPGAQMDHKPAPVPARPGRPAAAPTAGEGSPGPSRQSARLHHTPGPSGPPPAAPPTPPPLRTTPAPAMARPGPGAGAQGSPGEVRRNGDFAPPNRATVVPPVVERPSRSSPEVKNTTDLPMANGPRGQAPLATPPPPRPAPTEAAPHEGSPGRTNGGAQLDHGTGPSGGTMWNGRAVAPMGGGRGSTGPVRVSALLDHQMGAAGLMPNLARTKQEDNAVVAVVEASKPQASTAAVAPAVREDDNSSCHTTRGGSRGGETQHPQPHKPHPRPGQPTSRATRQTAMTFPGAPPPREAAPAPRPGRATRRRLEDDDDVPPISGGVCKALDTCRNFRHDPTLRRPEFWHAMSTAYLTRQVYFVNEIRAANGWLETDPHRDQRNKAKFLRTWLHTAWVKAYGTAPNQ